MKDWKNSWWIGAVGLLLVIWGPALGSWIIYRTVNDGTVDPLVWATVPAVLFAFSAVIAMTAPWVGRWIDATETIPVANWNRTGQILLFAASVPLCAGGVLFLSMVRRGSNNDLVDAIPAAGGRLYGTLALVLVVAYVAWVIQAIAPAWRRYSRLRDIPGAVSGIANDRGEDTDYVRLGYPPGPFHGAVVQIYADGEMVSELAPGQMLGVPVRGSKVTIEVRPARWPRSKAPRAVVKVAPGIGTLIEYHRDSKPRLDVVSEEEGTLTVVDPRANRWSSRSIGVPHTQQPRTTLKRDEQAVLTRRAARAAEGEPVRHFVSGAAVAAQPVAETQGDSTASEQTSPGGAEAARRELPVAHVARFRSATPMRGLDYAAASVPAAIASGLVVGGILGGLVSRLVAPDAGERLGFFPFALAMVIGGVVGWGVFHDSRRARARIRFSEFPEPAAVTAIASMVLALLSATLPPEPGAAWALTMLGLATGPTMFVSWEFREPHFKAMRAAWQWERRPAIVSSFTGKGTAHVRVASLAPVRPHRVRGGGPSRVVAAGAPVGFRFKDRTAELTVFGSHESEDVEVPVRPGYTTDVWVRETGARWLSGSRVRDVLVAIGEPAEGELSRE